MKGTYVFLLLAAPLLVCAQKNLTELSKKSSGFFLQQKSLAKSYSRLHGVPLITKDKQGTSIHLMGVSPEGLPIYWSTLNANAAITTGVVQLRTGGSVGLNLQGSGMTVGVWDAGRVKDHIELDTRVISKEGTDYDNHSTHVTGTLIATGINPAAKGMAPLAQAVTHDFDNDEAEMAALADVQGLLLSNHSYATVTGWYKSSGVWHWSGNPAINAIEDYRFGFYGDRAQALDQIAALAPYYTMVWATGNDRADVGDGTKPADCNGGSGYDCITPEATAKNVISVGAVDKVLSYSGPFDVPMSFFSSWGPTDDGRIKPDLVGDGVGLFSLTADGTDAYTTMTGTSMASPNVCGSLTLLQELFKKLHAGSVMKAATLKALAIHTAKEAGAAQGPDYSFGWGLLDASAAASALLNDDENSVVIKELTLLNDSTFRLALHPKANKKITATIVWTDVPGSPASPSLDPVQSMLVNDLDLRIVDGEGKEQLPWTLDPSNPSHPAVAGDNFRDNVEKLEFGLPDAIDYTVTVTHKGKLIGGSQDFSLVLTYEPTVSSKTYYWVGDAGQWNDGTHWSAQTGGTPINAVPGAGDRVIIDENSFDGVGIDLITMTHDASCGSFIWMNSKPSGVSFNGHGLTVALQAVIGSESFQAPTVGTFHFQNVSGAGDVSLINNNLTQVKLLFDGIWTIKGDFTANTVAVNAGTINWEKGVATLTQFDVGAAVASLQFSGTEIHLTGPSTINGTSLPIRATSSSMVIDAGSVSLQWQNVNWPMPVSIRIPNSVSIAGANHFSIISGNGSINVIGSNKIDSLLLNPGAHLNLNPGSSQTISVAQLSGTATSPVVLNASADALIEFANHQKFCFDYLNVTHVNTTGLAIVNAGTHSIVSNSTGWKQVDCDAVLFADFRTEDTCTSSLIQFTDESSGPIASYRWHFADGSVSSEQNAVWKISTAGLYNVTHTVTGASGADSVKLQITVSNNDHVASQLVVGNGALTGVDAAMSYQWYRNGAAVAGATSRSIQFEDDGGAYFLVSYYAQCNTVSDTVAVTGLAEMRIEQRMFPNPANKTLQVFTDGTVRNLVILDMTGRVVFQQAQPVSDLQVDTALFAEGMYVIVLQSAAIVDRKKLMIRHTD